MSEGQGEETLFDYLIVGSGLFGAVCARQLTDGGKRCLVLEKRPHIGGNVYTEKTEGIVVHRYGAHIFHTSDRKVWDYVNRFAIFNRFVNSPVARYKNECYNLPFNMNTFTKLWSDVFTPDEAKARIEEERRADYTENPSNLEEQALNLVGRTIYEKLIEGYTRKQWGRPCTQLPPFIIRRLPVRFTFDNNYFDDLFQGIPEGGYMPLIEKLLDGIEVRLRTDFLSDKEGYSALARRIIYTGPIDAFFGFAYGALEYRSLSFETEIFECENFQGNAVVNYTDSEVPYTRIIEHKHFEPQNPERRKRTVISREYPAPWAPGKEPYYPVNDEKNGALYARYRALAERRPDVIFGGRLGAYTYFDMHRVVASALETAEKELKRFG